MGSLLVQLLPLIIGSVMTPTWVLLNLMMLRGEHGLAQAIAFVSGITAVRLVQGIIFGAVVVETAKVGPRPSTVGTIVSTLLVVTGILLWATALQQLFLADERDSPLPKLMRMLSALTPLRALGLGVVLVVTSSRAWIFTLTALGIIGQAGVGYPEGVVAYLLFVLGTIVLLVAPILIFACTRSTLWLDTTVKWLEEHNRPIVVVVSFLVGCFFVWRGLSGLLS